MSDATASPRNLRAAGHLLDTFLLDTGVVGDAPPRRYLWTDAFAVCTLLGLDDADLEPELEGVERYRAVAVRLVDQVHHVLGRHRPDDAREGWISGLPEAQGEAQPTAGGLRIGKPLPERAPDEPMDQNLEWDRDGQYFHYLTKWMHALRRVGAAERDATYVSWAVALAKAAHRGFVHGRPDGTRHLYWKMSIDLSRPLIPTTGRHDPLDGYITYRTLLAPGAGVEEPSGAGLQEEIADLGRMAGLHNWGRWVTDDPLGIGGLLWDACRVAQLRAQGVAVAEGLLVGLLEAAERGLDAYQRAHPLDGPPAERLPFRELGLSIGLHALERMSSLIRVGGIPGVSEEVEAKLSPLMEFAWMARQIEAAWADAESREGPTWRAHSDINTVMLATSLAPRGYLDL